MLGKPKFLLATLPWSIAAILFCICASAAARMPARYVCSVAVVVVTGAASTANGVTEHVVAVSEADIENE
jgi:hypothetical protein